MKHADQNGTATFDPEALQNHLNAACASLTKIGEAMNEASRGLSEVFAEIDRIVKEADANARR